MAGNEVSATAKIGNVETSAVTNERALDDYNVLLISIDDLPREMCRAYKDEYTNSFWNGGGSAFPYPYTPTLDEMVAEGVLFNQARTNAPLCSPARANLITGAGLMTHGVGAIVSPTRTSSSFESAFVSPSPVVPVLPQMLAGTPYEGSRIMIGKVHHTTIDYDAANGLDYVRQVYGYDKFAGIMRNLNNDYLVENDAVLDSTGAAGDHENYRWVDDGVMQEINGVTSSQRCQVRLQQILNNNELTETGAIKEPWICSLNFPAVHGPFGPWHASNKHAMGSVPDEVIDGMGDVTYPDGVYYNSRMRMFLEHLDTRLLLLKQNIGEQWDRTIKIIYSDNGSEDLIFSAGTNEVFYPADALTPDVSSNPEHTPDSTLLSTVVPGDYDDEHSKGEVYELGVGAFMCVSGPIVKNPGRVSDHLVDMIDIVPTVLRICGATKPSSVEGLDFYDVLRDNTATENRTTSVGGRWTPNGLGQTRTRFDAYALRRDGSDIWKVVRRYAPTATPAFDELLFFNVSPTAHGGDGPLELSANELGTSHAEFVDTLEIMTDYFGSEYVPVGG